MAALMAAEAAPGRSFLRPLGRPMPRTSQSLLHAYANFNSSVYQVPNGSCTPVCTWTCDSPKCAQTCSPTCSATCQAPVCKLACPAPEYQSGVQPCQTVC